MTTEDLIEADRAPLVVRSDVGAGAGVTGAGKIDAYLPSIHQDIHFKAKKVPGRLDGWNNSPRKEMASYKVQEYFLDPVDYAVPTTALRCVTLEQWAEHRKAASPSVEGTNCVLVALSMWLEDVTLPKPLYDPERFATDARYAYYLANFNIVTYLVDHRDNRTGNFLVSEDDTDRRVYAIDNGVTFGDWFFNWFYPPSYAWRKIQVPALPRVTVERLRKLSRSDLDPLGVIVQLEPNEEGILQVVEPGPPFDPDKGVRVQGTTVQFGLEKNEIDDVWERIEELLEDVDEGRLALF